MNVPHITLPPYLRQMKKPIALFILILLVAEFSFGQNSVERCSYQGALEQLIEKDPSQLENLRDARDQIEAKLLNQESRSGTVYQIPVVFHVVYNNAEQNVSMDAIYSQLDVLNEDYRKQNSDISQVPTHFSGLAADCEIEFCLAHVDPEGNWTDGVTRTQTSTSMWNGGSTAMMSEAGGGHDPWPHSEYLNVWVVNMNPNFLGYAYPPGVNPNGMVIGYKNFGRIGSYLTSIYNKGRTATHEIGHWLDLHHPWGPGADNSDCTASDLVDDTPMQAEPNYNCPSGIHISCNNGPNGDMHMNFLDYANDACMHFFTEGQKARMRAALEGPRASILSSPGCDLTSVYDSELSKQINVFPNPANEEIRIDAAPWIGDRIQVRILNGIGQVVLDIGSVVVDPSKLRFNISGLDQGFYLVDITAGNERAVKRFTKI